jgi:hypothetical protein
MRIFSSAATAASAVPGAAPVMALWLPIRCRRCRARVIATVNRRRPFRPKLPSFWPAEAIHRGVMPSSTRSNTTIANSRPWNLWAVPTSVRLLPPCSRSRCRRCRSERFLGRRHRGRGFRAGGELAVVRSPSSTAVVRARETAGTVAAPTPSMRTTSAAEHETCTRVFGRPAPAGRHGEGRSRRQAQRTVPRTPSRDLCRLPLGRAAVSI